MVGETSVRGHDHAIGQSVHTHITYISTHLHHAHKYTNTAPLGAAHHTTKMGACSIDVWLSEPDCAMYTHCATLTLHALV